MPAVALPGISAVLAIEGSGIARAVAVSWPGERKKDSTTVFTSKPTAAKTTATVKRLTVGDRRFPAPL
jgi:hypothetical protein